MIRHRIPSTPTGILRRRLARLLTAVVLPAATALAFCGAAAAATHFRVARLPEGSQMLEQKTGVPSRQLTSTLADWISLNFDLPRMREAPHFDLVPAEYLVSLRMRDVASDRMSAAAIEPGSILAVYDSRAATIYLDEHWTGQTPAEVSIVLHELVHHIQKEAGLKLECVEAGERTAFAAQEAWLSLHGTTLEAEFGLDPFTLLVRTTCAY